MDGPSESTINPIHNELGSDKSSSNRCVPIKSETDALPTPPPPTTPAIPATSSHETGEYPSSSLICSETFSMPLLNKIVSETSPELLEAAMETGVDLLKTISIQLLDCKDSERASQVVDRINKIAERARHEDCYIPIVGATGAGKSSFINAILGEKKVVPTSCMRACTAVATEIRWNDSDDPDLRYRAEVEFVSTDEWAQEIEYLLGDLVVNGKLSPDYTNVETQAGIAYAKIRAVYPTYNKEALQQCTKETLLSVPEVRDALKKHVEIAKPDCATFYKELQGYLETVSNFRGRKKMAIWPLIKVVRIFLKSPVLASGIVLVDLPGTQDDNAARSSMAKKYLDRASAIWIVAPITRAVNDKAAKVLLGDHFKLRLQMNGSYSNVTFVCTKSDDILVSEAVDGLTMLDDVQNIQTRIDQLEQDQQLKQNVLEKNKSEAKNAQNELRAHRKQKQDLLRMQKPIKDRLTVLQPVDKSLKRKPSAARETSLKNRDHDKLSFEDDFSAYEVPKTVPEVIAVDDDPPPLAQDVIDLKLSTLQPQLKFWESKCENYHTTSQETQDQLDSIRSEIAELSSKLKRLCIQGRNQVSTESIRSDFAAGIKELDEEIALERDGDNFDPDLRVRDYDEVAKDLPVFCISSRVYQKMTGNFQDDVDVDGFESLEDTGIRQLQQHALQANASLRTAKYQILLAEFRTELDHIHLWLNQCQRVPGSSLGVADKAAAVASFKAAFLELNKTVQTQLLGASEEMRSILKTTIYTKTEPAIQKAVAKALGICDA